MFGRNSVGLEVKISADATGAVAGIESTGTSVEKLAGGVADRATGILKKGITAGGAVAAAALGTALYKGFNRLSSIDQAEAKLRGLGHSADSVSGIMDNALNSVRGTAFGLDEAASTAAGTVAAGIAPGEELERVLKLTADTATIAGSSMGEMGSIFNKVAASNRLSMGEVNQLADRGVPIMSMLADQYGVTAEEARKMVSDGKVDFADFSAAIEENIAGAALESGSTVSGAFANMNAALGRVGAQLLGGVFPQLSGGFGSLTEALDNLGPYAEEIGAKIGVWAAETAEKLLPALQAAGDWIINSLVPALADMGQWVQDNRAWLEPLAVALLSGVAAITAIVQVVRAWTAAQAILNAVLLANPIGIVIVALAALVGGLLYAWHNVDGFRDGVLAAWDWIKNATGAAWDWITAKTSQVWTWITQTVPAWVSDMATRVVGFFARLGIDAIAKVTQLKDNAIARVTELKNKVVGFFGDLKDQAVAKVRQLKDDTLARLREMPGQALSIGGDIISGLIDGIKGAAGRLGTAAVDAVKGGLSAAKNFLGIRSPSRRWRDEIGRMMGRGAADGLVAETKHVTDAARKLLSIPADVATDIPDPHIRLTADRRGSTQTAGRSNRAPVQITVEGALDPVSVARQIKQLLDQYDALVTAR